jgi:hypothetical protein
VLTFVILRMLIEDGSVTVHEKGQQERQLIAHEDT